MRRAAILAGMSACVVLVAFGITFLLPEKAERSFGLPNELTEPSKRYIDSYSMRWKNLAVISVLTLDFHNNRRRSLYTVVPNASIKARMDEYKTKTPGLGAVSHIFSDNKAQNADIIPLINGEFTCVDGAHSLFAVQYDLQEKITTSCRVPIDPASGRIVGYIVMHFTAPPPKSTDMKQIEADTRVLATTIYYNEILPAAGR